MSVLTSIPNLKIPYPTEGVIRTAALDDTVSPENSVQLAVNMNFDRVGAMQSRPGVTSYADQLADAINSFGTLRNSIIPPGYESIYQLGDTSAIATTFDNPGAVKLSDTEIVVFWSGADNDGYCQKFEIDQATGTVTPLGTALEFEAANNNENRPIRISATRVLNVWSGPSTDAFAQCFNVSGDDITAEGSPLEFDTANGQHFTLASIDSTHVICFYTSTGSDGVATVFEIDGGGNVTEPGSPLTFDSGTVDANSCAPIGNGTHFVNFWASSTVGKAQTFEVDTGTWAVTAIGSALTFDATDDQNTAMAVGDGEHFVVVYQNATAFYAQAFNVDPGTYAVTEVGTGVAVYSGGGNDIAAAAFGDGEHFAAFYSKTVGDGYVQLLEMDPVTFDLSLVGSPLSGYDFANSGYTAPVALGDYKVMAVWGNVDGTDGKAAMFQTLGEVVNGRWLYAGHDDKVSNWDGAAWTERRSGLATVSKPRFSQYLNYIWMVNGNEQIGGDPVATSDGTDFGTDLVPDGFPRGDFIHAGFEGRVWVANKTLGIIYYTDIVQFLPPSTYTLTYNPEVNFITTLAPQTGQQFTALCEVPRALLVFTEDTITRIYGATSVDAYPAYNVGTYSQESIVRTKTGIFFHHSSGFYQFDYGSQPVEISRRIIDFVQAIPRSAYEDVVGVYDGFDAVEWSVGSVTVEGVTFSSCVLRYTISTQVWTVYDYVGNTITAMVQYDDGTTLSHLMGTAAGKTGAMDVGTTDFGLPFYYEFIDRWRPFKEMYYQTANVSGFNVYNDNAAGANLMYQPQGARPNEWTPIGTVDEKSNSLLPNQGTDAFEVLRLRLAGNTQGAPVVVHCIELTEMELKGQDRN
jgi:hypothetical protein